MLLLSFPPEVVGTSTHYNIKIFLILCLNGLCGYALARKFCRGPVGLSGGVWLSEPCCGSRSLWIRSASVHSLVGSSVSALLFRAERKGTWQSGALAGLVFGLASAFYWFYGLFFLAMFIALWGCGSLSVSGDDCLGKACLLGWFRWWELEVLSILFFLPTSTQQGLDSRRGALFPNCPFSAFSGIRRHQSSSFETGNLRGERALFLESSHSLFLVSGLSLEPRPSASFAVDGLSWVCCPHFCCSSLSRTCVFDLGVRGFLPGNAGPLHEVFWLLDTTEVMHVGGDWVVRLPYAWMFR